MPASWSDKDERMYDVIRISCEKRGDRDEAACKRIAAATVNKEGSVPKKKSTKKTKKAGLRGTRPTRSRISGKLDLAEDMAEKFELARSCPAKLNVYEQAVGALGGAVALNERRGGRLSNADVKRLRSLNTRVLVKMRRELDGCLCGTED